MPVDNGTNDNAAEWVDPEEAKGEYADGHPGEALDEGQIYIEDRLAALRDSGELTPEEPVADKDSEEDPKEEPEASEAEEEAEEEEPTTKEKESFSEGLVRLMEKETQLRAERKELDEYKAQVAEYNQAVANFKHDPVRALKALGVSSEDDYLALARVMYNESLGEEAPQEYSANRQLAELQREIQELKQGMQSKSSQAEQEAQLTAYTNSLHAQLDATDLTQYPMIERLRSKVGDVGVQQDIMTAAEQFVAQNNGQVPTPQQAVEMLNQLYDKQFGWLIEQNEEVPGKEVATKRKTRRGIRNKNNQSQSEPDSIEKYAKGHGDPNDYEKLKELTHKNFAEFLKRQG